MALWCTVIDGGHDRAASVVKEVFAAFSAGAAAGPGQFRGQATMGEHGARWDLAISGGQAPLRPLRPAMLYRAPLPRTKLVAAVPDGQVTGTVQIEDRTVTVSGWRGTVGRNWGSEHADSWVWLHAADFGAEPQAWVELVLARIRIGPARSPWTAMGALSLRGTRIPLGGLGRRTRVDARPDRLTAEVPSHAARLRFSVTAGNHDPVAVTYADPGGGTRTVTHAALAAVEVSVHRQGHRELTLSGGCGAYEYGTSQPVLGVTPRALPAG